MILSVSSSNVSSMLLISSDNIRNGLHLSCNLVILLKKLDCEETLLLFRISRYSLALNCCNASPQHPVRTHVPALSMPSSAASSTAFSAASLIPVPFSAEISTTSQPSFFDSLSMLILSPFFSNQIHHVDCHDNRNTKLHAAVWTDTGFSRCSYHLRYSGSHPDCL